MTFVVLGWKTGILGKLSSIKMQGILLINEGHLVVLVMFRLTDIPIPGKAILTGREATLDQKKSLTTSKVAQRLTESSITLNSAIRSSVLSGISRWVNGR